MTSNTKKFFLTKAGVENEVSVEEFCQVERKAGFFPKLPANDPLFKVTPATAGFFSNNSVFADDAPISGRIEFVEVKVASSKLSSKPSWKEQVRQALRKS